MPENGHAEPDKFKVGVFCGNYIALASDGYFDHLEKIRSESRKRKAMETARKAVVGGIATRQDVQVAANGANLGKEGKVIREIQQQNPENVFTEEDPLETANTTFGRPSDVTPQLQAHGH